MSLDTKAPAVAPEKHLTRTGIMLVIAPVVIAALKTIPGLDQGGTDAIRRTFRALMTIGVKMMLDAGLHPMLIVKEAQTAIGAELKERQEKAKEQGATMPPATLPS